MIIMAKVGNQNLKILSAVFALSMVWGPVLAWGWGGNGDCPYSKDKVNQEKTEQVEEWDK